MIEKNLQGPRWADGGKRAGRRSALDELPQGLRWEPGRFIAHICREAARAAGGRWTFPEAVRKAKLRVEGSPKLGSHIKGKGVGHGARALYQTLLAHGSPADTTADGRLVVYCSVTDETLAGELGENPTTGEPYTRGTIVRYRKALREAGHIVTTPQPVSGRVLGYAVVLPSGLVKIDTAPDQAVQHQVPQACNSTCSTDDTAPVARLQQPKNPSSESFEEHIERNHQPPEAVGGGGVYIPSEAGKEAGKEAVEALRGMGVRANADRLVRESGATADDIRALWRYACSPEGEGIENPAAWVVSQLQAGLLEPPTDPNAEKREANRQAVLQRQQAEAAEREQAEQAEQRQRQEYAVATKVAEVLPGWLKKRLSATNPVRQIVQARAFLDEVREGVLERPCELLADAFMVNDKPEPYHRPMHPNLPQVIDAQFAGVLDINHDDDPEVRAREVQFELEMLRTIVYGLAVIDEVDGLLDDTGEDQLVTVAERLGVPRDELRVALLQSRARRAEAERIIDGLSSQEETCNATS